MPILGDVPVAKIDRALVIRVLEPIWKTKTETASRVRGRIEAVLDWAAARDYRGGDNPARWKGHLSKLFPTRSKLRKPKPALRRIATGRRVGVSTVSRFPSPRWRSFKPDTRRPWHRFCLPRPASI
jgi:hypothetical protein